MAFMQSRLGPNDTGPYGSLQLIAEAIKFLQKRTSTRTSRSASVSNGASRGSGLNFPLIRGPSAGPDAIVQNLDTGVFYAMAVSSLSVLGILMAGWASANKYAFWAGSAQLDN